MSTELRTILEQFFKGQDNWKIKLLSEFPTIIGENLASHVSLLKITENSVTIGIHNSCLLQELSTLKPLLLSKINQTLDIPRIRSIQLKLRGQSKAKPKRVMEKHEPQQSNVVVLSDQDQKLLSHIHDEELACVLGAYAKRCYRESAWKRE